MPRFVFSALYNESAEYLGYFVQNFLNFTDDDSVLFVNVSQSSPAPVDQSFGPRVQLFRGRTSRAAWGPTLLAGHMDCFDAASKMFPDFEWFITTASNSLFFRPFNAALAIQAAETMLLPQKAPVKWDDLPGNWHWPKMRKHRAVGEILQHRWGIEGLDSGQIEGRMARRSDWSIVNAVQCDIFDCWVGLEAPLEEILPVTVFNALGSGKSCNICRVNWGRPEEQGGRFSNIWELMDPVRLPPQICMMKWFQRDARCAETLAVCTPLGRDLLAALQGSMRNPQMELEIETLLRGIISGFERLQSRAPITWLASSTEPVVFSLEKIVARRQICSFDGGPAILGENYFYFEDTGATLTLDLEFQRGNWLKLRCDLVAATGSSDFPTSSLQGYVYLTMPVGRSMRMRLRGNVYGVAPDQFLSHITWHAHGKYVIKKPIFQTILISEFTADFQCHGSSGPAHIGLPIFAGQNMTVEAAEVADRV